MYCVALLVELGGKLLSLHLLAILISLRTDRFFLKSVQLLLQYLVSTCSIRNWMFPYSKQATFDDGTGRDEGGVHGGCKTLFSF